MPDGPLPRIEFRRSDGTVNTFLPSSGPGVVPPEWTRQTPDGGTIALRVEAGSGWRIRAADGVLLGIPWDREHEEREMPGEGKWVSSKGDKAYVYEMHIVQHNDPRRNGALLKE